MAKEILTNAGIWLQQYDLSGSANALAIEGTTETRDCTTFGDGTRTYAIGPKTAAFSSAGFLDVDIDAGLQSRWGLTNQTVTLGSTKAAGAIAFVGNVLVGQYSPNATYGEVWAYSLAASLASRSFGRGRILHSNTAVIATGTGTVHALRGISAAKKAFATLHVMSITGTATPTITARIESDDAVGFTTPILRGTFTARTTVGAQMIEIDGPILPPETFWRAAWTITGTTPSFNVLIALGFEEPV